MLIRNPRVAKFSARPLVATISLFSLLISVSCSKVDSGDGPIFDLYLQIATLPLFDGAAFGPIQEDPESKSMQQVVMFAGSMEQAQLMIGEIPRRSSAEILAEAGSQIRSEKQGMVALSGCRLSSELGAALKAARVDVEKVRLAIFVNDPANVRIKKSAEGRDIEISFGSSWDNPFVVDGANFGSVAFRSGSISVSRERVVVSEGTEAAVNGSEYVARGGKWFGSSARSGK